MTAPAVTPAERAHIRRQIDRRIVDVRAGKVQLVEIAWLVAKAESIGEWGTACELASRAADIARARSAQERGRHV